MTIIQCSAECVNNDGGICALRTVKQGFYWGEFSCDGYTPPKADWERDDPARREVADE